MNHLGIETADRTAAADASLRLSFSGIRRRKRYISPAKPRDYTTPTLGYQA